VTTTYAYDRTGVLLSRYDAPTTTSYAYDAYGNLTSHASAVNQNTTMTYDLADRLLTVVLPGPGNTTTAFSLDALGRIATRTPPGGSPEPFSYLGTSETVWSIGGVTTVSSALDPSGARVASQSGAATGFLLSDLHGNVATATNSGETALLSATRYDPFGLTSASWDSGSAFPMPWKFQARLDLTANPADPLYEFSARYYLPATGAFSQLDSYPGSVGDPLSLHRYLYAAANPWTLIDPTGHAFVAGDEPGSQDAVYTSDGELHWINHGPAPAPGSLPSQATPQLAEAPYTPSEAVRPWPLSLLDGLLKENLGVALPEDVQQLGGCFKAGVGFGLYVGVELCAFPTDQGIAIHRGVSFGGGTPSAGAFLGVAWSNESHPSRETVATAGGGISLGEGLAFASDGWIGYRDGTKGGYAGVGGAVFVPLPAEVHGVVTVSEPWMDVSWFDLFQLLIGRGWQAL
jgi:RHS repeat-associated protein